MKKIVNINGTLHVENPIETAKISVYDRGFLFGDSIYEVTKTQNGKMFFWPEHYLRLEDSAHRLSLSLPFDYQEITQEILKTLKAANIQEAYMRLVVSRGEGFYSLDPKDTRTKGNFVIFVDQLSKPEESIYQTGTKLTLSSIQRNSVRALDPKIKSGNYLNNMLAHKEAKEKTTSSDQQIYDALMLNERGEISEGPTFNLFFFKDGIYYTPHLSSGLLRRHYQKFCDSVTQGPRNHSRRSSAHP